MFRQKNKWTSSNKKPTRSSRPKTMEKNATETRAFNFWFFEPVIEIQSIEWTKMDVFRHQARIITTAKRKKFAADVRVKRTNEQADDAHVRDLQSNEKKKLDWFYARILALAFLWLPCTGAYPNYGLLFRFYSVCAQSHLWEAMQFCWLCMIVISQMDFCWRGILLVSYQVRQYWIYCVVHSITAVTWSLFDKQNSTTISEKLRSDIEKYTRDN